MSSSFPRELLATCARSEILARVERVPQLRKRADEFARQVQPELSEPDAREAAAAAAAEFILEGLHVHNKLNKTSKAGATSYKR